MRIEILKNDLRKMVEKFSEEKKIDRIILEEFLQILEKLSEDRKSTKREKSVAGRELTTRLYDLWKENTGTELIFDWGPALGAMKTLSSLLNKSGIESDVYFNWLIRVHRNTIVKYGISMVVPLLNEYQIKNKQEL